MDRGPEKASAAVKPGLSLDVALAVQIRKRAYEDREAGRDPLPNLRRSLTVFAPEDAFAALDVAVDALLRATEGDLDQLVGALWLDDDLADDADAFATGVTGP